MNIVIIAVVIALAIAGYLLGPARLKVILTAAVTWLVTVAAILVIVIGELGQRTDLPPVIVQALGTLLTVITVAIAIIRRVTPVIPADRGILRINHKKGG